MIGNKWDEILKDEYKQEYFMNLIDFIKTEYKNLSLKGLHAHIGSQIFEKKVYFDALIKERGIITQYLIAIGMLLLILVFGIYGQGYDATQFIYFQF